MFWTQVLDFHKMLGTVECSIGHYYHIFVVSIQTIGLISQKIQNETMTMGFRIRYKTPPYEKLCHHFSKLVKVFHGVKQGKYIKVSTNMPRTGPMTLGIACGILVTTQVSFFHIAYSTLNIHSRKYELGKKQLDGKLLFDHI